MNEEQRFSRYAAKLRQHFPTWTAIRKDPNSIGGQFLSVIGLRLDEVDWMLTYAYEQTGIQTADINHIDMAYKARIPNGLTPDMSFRFIGGSHVLIPVETELDFIQREPNVQDFAALQRDVRCYIDYDRKLIYVKQPFGQDETYRHGALTLTINGVEDLTQVMPLTLNPIWNFFDEFGLLLGVQRLEGERNASYKERILDVFRRPANATKEGVRNGIARELGLTKRVNWKDPTQNLVLREPRVDGNTLLVNNEPISSTGWYKDRDGRVVLIATGGSEEKSVHYIAGVSLHELHDKEDAGFQERLYDIDGSPTPLLKYYVESIRNRLPFLWGEWRWDQGAWDAGEFGYEGFNALPTLLDADFTGWTKEEETAWN